MIWDMINPSIKPMIIPPPAILMKSTTLVNKLNSLPVMAIEIIRPNKTIEVPSLRRLSPSRRTCSRLGTPMVRKRAITATGSIAATMAPNTNVYRMGMPVPQLTNAPTIAMVRITPGMAKVNITTRSRRKSWKFK